jgi:hypothetical protein
MMKIVRATLFLCLALAALFTRPACAQFAPQQIVLEGLLTQNHRGSFSSSAFAPDGSLYLLLDEGDGIRVLKTDSSGSTLEAQLHLGAAGDSGVALAADPNGNIYVAGTSSSGALSGTSGVPFPAPADGSTNSFIAKLDSQLNLVFLTFVGSGHTAVSSIAANANAVFVTGSIFSSTLPVTSAGLQQIPAGGSNVNGFVESFSANGAALNYATYLSGANGDTEPAAIVADSAGHAFVAGETSSAAFPTLHALQSAIADSTSGFLAELPPAGDGLVYSTFIAGSGITGLALDTAANSILLTGSVAPGQFPVAVANTPLTSANYQSLVQVSADGQTLTSSVILAPGTQSSVAAAPDGSAWVAMPLSVPLLPATIAASSQPGDSLLLHVLATGAFGQSLRIGGAPIGNAGYASLATALAAPSVSPDGSRIAAPGTVTLNLDSSLFATQHFDFATVGSPNSLLPNGVHDVVPDATSCGTASQCMGTGALLAIVDPTTAAPTLALSTDDSPAITLSNLGSGAASSLSIAANGYTVSTDCGASLTSGAQCGIALNGSGPGSLTLSASSFPSTTLTFSTANTTPDPLALSSSELDFGIVSATGSPATRSLTVTNLSSAAQTFTVALDDGPSLTAYTLALSSTTCAQASAKQLTVAPSSSCTLTFSLTAASSSPNDGAVRATWRVGSRDVLLTGFSQAAALSLSSSEIDFGQQSPLKSSPHLPRYLFISNNSTAAVAHTLVTLPGDSPFAITDGCPSTLQPQSVCRLTITYSSPTAPSLDSATLTLDGGQAVLLTGQTLSPQSVSGSTADPNVSVSPASISFPDPVTVTELSSSTQSVQITNAGPTAIALTATITGDFTFENQCPATLAASASCSILVTFAPSQPGVREGLLSISAGGVFSPTTVMLSGTANAILPANNGTLSLGETNIGEPIIEWYSIQAALPSLTINSSDPAFTIALVANNGSTQQPTLPASAFAASASGSCVNCWLGIQFLSQTPGTQNATLSLSTVTAGHPEAIALSATATPLSGLQLTPTSPSFGSIPIHSTTSPVTFTLTNLFSPAANANIQSITASGDFSVLPIATGDCGQSIAATASCTVEVAFAPTAQGARNGTLTVVTDAGSVTATLSGFGTADPGLALQPNALVFNNQAGTAATQQTVTVTNTSTSAVTIGAPTTATTVFTVSSTCGTLAPSAQCSIAVTFTPGATFAQDTLTLPVSTGSGAQLATASYTVPLSGTYTSSSAGLIITPSLANLGSAVTGGVGSTRQFSISNVTTQPVSLSLSLPRQFPLAGATDCTSLAAGATCTLSVSLAPAVNGALTGTLQITGTPSNGSPIQSLAYLLGYGQGTGALTITGATSPINFGNVASGQSQQQTLTLTNSGSGALTIHRVISQPPFLAATTCSAALAPAASCTVALTYSPVYELASGSTASPIRQDTGILTIESDAVSSPDTLPLAGTATAVTAAQPASSSVLASYALSTSALTFAATQVGNLSSAQNITLTNRGTSTLHIASILAPADFTTSSNCITLLPAATCTIAVQFTPGDLASQSLRTGTLEILSDAADALDFVTLVGDSTPAPLVLSPTSLDFGSVAVGQHSQLTVTATNSSASPITFGSLTSTGSYAVTNGTCPASGATLAAGAQCSLDITFAPTATGMQTGLLSLSSSATQLPLAVALTGVGTSSGNTQQQPGSFAITVNGSSSASLTVSSGQPAAFTLTATPANGFSGPIALTCAPLNSAPYASCSLLASTLTLGITSQTATATINTLTSTPQTSVRLAGVLLLSLFTLAATQFTRSRRKFSRLALLVLVGCGALSLSGCGGSSPAQAPSKDLLYTPPGTYQWTVTASSTTGPAISSSVVLTVTVQ